MKDTNKSFRHKISRLFVLLSTAQQQERRTLFVSSPGEDNLTNTAQRTIIYRRAAESRMLRDIHATAAQHTRVCWAAANNLSHQLATCYYITIPFTYI